jgi:ferredoxin
MHTLQRRDLSTLIEVLARRGHTVVGPVERDGAVVFDTLRSAEELPAGRLDRQSPGEYRLEAGTEQTLFGYHCGPVSWKRYLYPPRQHLLTVRRAGKTLAFDPPGSNGTPRGVRYAFLGVRPCELAAILIQDRVYTEGDFADALYAENRRNAFIVAVNCTTAGGTCFCASMNTGPAAKEGYDLLLTEIVEGGAHSFTVETGSPAGEAVLAELPAAPADPGARKRVDDLIAAAARSMGRTLPLEGLPRALADNFEHPAWDDVARRCMTCANCTMVCPTCFCTAVEDTTDLTGTRAERTRRWDSCFTLDFARVAGGNFRTTTRSRYRQWLTHKLSSWVDQFGTPGCVGCGRCITWCPVGIDITEEARAVRSLASAPGA